MLSSTDSIALQSSASVNSHLSKSSMMHDRSRLEITSLGQEQQRHSSPHGSSSNGHRSLLSPLTLRGMNDPIQRQNSAPLTPSLDMLKERRTASPFDPNLLDLSSSLRELKVSLNPSQKPSLLSDTIRMHHSQPSSPMPQPTPDRNVTPLYLPDARMQSSQTSHVTNQSTHANSQYHGNSSHTPGNMSSGHVHDTKPKGEPSACIFVASLNATRTDEQLRESVLSQFSQFGSIIDIKVMRDSQGRPFAFVQYDSPENAKRALIQGHQKVLDGRPVRVEQARVNRTLFVTKYDRNLSEQQLRGELDSFGQIEELKFLRNAVSGRSKGCCFVRYHFREDAIRAFNGVRSKYHWGAEWTENLEKRESQVEPFEIFVGQLDPLLVTEQDLFNRFKKYGYIQRVQLIRRNYPGRAIRPSFAFITFTTTDAAEKAIEEENGQEWNNRPLKVTHRELYTDEHHGDGGGDAQQQEAAASGGGNQAGGGGHHAAYHQHGALMQQSPARIAKEHGMAGAYVNKPYAAPTTAVGYQATQPSMTAAQMYPTPYRQRTWSTTSSADSFIASYPILPIQSPYTVPYVAFAMMPPGATGGGTESLQHMVKSGGAQSDVTTYNSPAGVGIPATGLSTGGTTIPGIVPSTPPMTPMGYDWSAMMHMRTPTGPEQLLFGASSPPMIPSYYYPMQSISATTADTATVMSNDARTPVNMAGTSPIYVPFVSFPPVSTYTTQPQ